MVVHAKDMVKCPKDVPPKEWVYACERALRARKYAWKMLGQEEGTVFDRLTDDFQNPLWQWENEVRGRFGGVVGGNLKQ